jgi:hypothetical protein
MKITNWMSKNNKLIFIIQKKNYIAMEVGTCLSTYIVLTADLA